MPKYINTAETLRKLAVELDPQKVRDYAGDGTPGTYDSLIQESIEEIDTQTAVFLDVDREDDWNALVVYIKDKIGDES